jgi:nicotinamide mononucleotide adenylyltransferase
LLAGQVDAIAVHFHRLGVQIDRQLAIADDRLAMALGSADNRMHAGNQFVAMERHGYFSAVN